VRRERGHNRGALAATVSKDKSPRPTQPAKNTTLTTVLRHPLVAIVHPSTAT